MMYRHLTFLAMLFFFACNQTAESDSSTTEKTAPTPLDGTAQMIKILQEAHAQIDPMKVEYPLNTARARNIKQAVGQTTNPNEQLIARGQYANELLRAGNSLEAIIEIERLLEELYQYKAPMDVLHRVKGLLAISYLRLGEQENCIGKKYSEACILPIQGDGIYSLSKGSEAAIALYESMLKENPANMENVWLLNIAYMTLGKYPDGVPAQWRIPPSAFQSKKAMPPFRNLTGQLNLGTITLSGGSCIEDFDRDGLLDVMVSSWGLNDQIKLFKNQGDGSFKNITDRADLLGITGGLNMVHADYNNDGFADVFVLRGAWFGGEGRIPNSLLRNNRDGTFSDVTIESGLLSKYPTQTATWSDFNNDGWIDLFIGNESNQSINAPCELYLNQQGRFTNHTQQAGLGAIRGFVKGVCSGDVNNDGFADIYISILGQSNLLLINNGNNTEGGIISFKNATATAGVQEPIGSFPTWMWDVNQDGYLDLFAASYGSGNPKVAADMAAYFLKREYDESRVHIYINQKDGTFAEKAKQMGVTEPAYAMGANFGDIDNDGTLDFYLGTGAPNYSAIVPNKMYLNNQGKSFDDVTYVSRLGHIQKGHGVSFADFDNDGDQDIFHVLGGAFEGDVYSDALFENTSDGSNNWINILLEGTTSNRSAIGAKIILDCVDDRGAKRRFYHTVSTGGSFGSSSLQQEIGIGQSTKIERIEVQWPNAAQSTSVYNNVNTNQFIKITEGQEELTRLERKRFRF